MNRIYHAVYLSMFLSFARKLLRKTLLPHGRHPGNLSPYLLAIPVPSGMCVPIAACDSSRLAGRATAEIASITYLPPERIDRRPVSTSFLPEPMLDILRRDHILVLRGNLEGLPYSKDTIRKLRDIRIR